MAKPTSGARMIMALGLVAMLSGFLVVLVYQLTLAPIAANKQAMIEKAVFQVLPNATQRADFVVTDQGIFPEGEGMPIYAGYNDQGELQGIAAETAAQGYADLIYLLYGYDPRCQCITGIKVLKMAETPGLGDKIITDDAFVANFNALDAKLNAEGSALAHAIVTVKHGTKQNPWEIDAISGATVSSNAVGKALNLGGQGLLPWVVPKIGQIEK